MTLGKQCGIRTMELHVICRQLQMTLEEKLTHRVRALPGGVLNMLPTDDVRHLDTGFVPSLNSSH